MKKLLLLLVLATLVSCGGRTDWEKKVDGFLVEFNASSTDTYEVVKYTTVNAKDGHIVLVDNNGFHVVVNLNQYTTGMTEPEWQAVVKAKAIADGIDIQVFIEADDLGNGNFQGIKRHGFDSTGAFTSVNITFGDLPDYIFDENNSSVKDLETMGAKVEVLEVAEMEDTLINYGLSADRATKLGKMMNSYSKIKNKRALTAREKDVFTKELTGMSFDKASSVLVDEGYDALVEKASEVNGADPEAIKELLNEVM